MRSLDIIVPCYNEAECLSALYEKIQDVLSLHKSLLLCQNFLRKTGT